MNELTPKQISELLINRLSRTNQLLERVGENNLEEEKAVYFKYYFDFSTAIETIIYNIVKQKYGLDKFACAKIGVDNPATSKYFRKDDVVSLLDGFGCDITWKDYKDKLMGICSALCDRDFQRFADTKLISDIEAFSSFYTTSRETRNHLAHGLMEQNVRYDKNTLEKFTLSYFVLFSYYEDLYNNARIDYMAEE